MISQQGSSENVGRPKVVTQKVSSQRLVGGVSVDEMSVDKRLMAKGQGTKCQ
jgi:hypothetical protein